MCGTTAGMIAKSSAPRFFEPSFCARRARSDRDATISVMIIMKPTESSLCVSLLSTGGGIRWSKGVTAKILA